MKNKVLLSRLCICTLAVSLLAGCSSAGSTSETTNNSERICLSSRTALMKPCSRRHPPDILLKNQM